MILKCDFYLPLEKSVALHLLIKQIPSTQTCFVSSLVEIGPVALKKKIFLNIILLFDYYLPLGSGEIIKFLLKMSV